MNVNTVPINIVNSNDAPVQNVSNHNQSSTSKEELGIFSHPTFSLKSNSYFDNIKSENNSNQTINNE